MREAIKNARRKIERLADFARGASAAIGNDICRHGGAVFAITPVNFLNHTFATITAWKIEINIGPAFAALVKKAFENQIVVDRIDRRDPKAITNRAVGGAAASLHHNVVLATEIHDVPDDQKISRKPEFGDERKLFFEFLRHRAADRSITLLRAKPRDRTQE